MVESSSGSALLPSGRWPVNLSRANAIAAVAVSAGQATVAPSSVGQKTAGKHEGRLSITRVDNGSLRLTPLGDNLVVRCLSGDERPQVEINGTSDDDSSEPPNLGSEKPLVGRVLSIGDGRLSDDGTRVAPRYQEGDKVLFHRSAGTEIDVDGDELLVLEEDDVLMRLP